MSAAVFVYLHGFLSSPQSLKAQQLQRYLQNNAVSIACKIPDIPEEPHLALEVIDRVIDEACTDYDTVGILGSSLGGFYATVFAQRYDRRAVLINPSVLPHLRFADFIHPSNQSNGAMQNPYTGRHFTLREHDLVALAEAAPEKIINPNNFWLLAQMGDEVLDYRDAVAYYSGCKQTIEPGGDHQFQDFARHLPAIVNFLQ